MAASLHNLARGLESIDLASLDDGEPLQIKLDPALTPAKNMEAWFRRARKARKGLTIIQERYEAATAQVLRIEAARDHLALAEENPKDRLAALQSWQTDHGSVQSPSHLLCARQCTGRCDQQWQRGFVIRNDRQRLLLPKFGPRSTHHRPTLHSCDSPAGPSGQPAPYQPQSKARGQASRN